MASPIHSPTIRAFILAQNLHKSHGRSPRASETEGDLGHSIPGRPTVFCRFQRSGCDKPTSVTDSSQEFRLAPKSRQIKPRSNSGDEVSGLHHKLSSSKGLSPSRKDREDLLCSGSDSDKSPNICPIGYGSIGPPHGLNPIRTVGKATLQTPPEEHFASLVTPGVTGKVLQAKNKRKKSTLVVEKPKQPDKGSLVGVSSGQTSDNRRKCLGLGSSPGRANRSRDLVQMGSKKVIKLAGVKSHISGPPYLSTDSQRMSCSNSVRQHNSDSLCTKARGNQEPRSHGVSQTVVVLGRAKRNLLISGSPKGIPESVGRSAKQKECGGSRMESEPGDFLHDLQRVGDTSGRSICQPAKHKSPRILFSPQRGSGSWNRCSSTSMALPAVLRLSPISPNPISIKEVQGREHQSYPDCSILAKKTLVCDTPKPSRKSSLEATTQERLAITGLCEPSGSRQTTSDCLASEEDLLKAKGLSDKVVRTLLSSRKEVTRAIYLKVWKKFNSWCSSKNFIVKSVVSVLEFLHEGMEKGLAASTLKTQVAALSVYFEKTLSKEALISRFFRALARNRPIVLKVFPSWDLSVVLQGLTGAPFEPLQETSLRNLIFKTIFLVAITSARRVSELQALAVTEPFLRVFPDRVILQTDPAFLPKVSSTFHRSQEITLPTFSSVPNNAGEEAFHTLDVRRCLLQFLAVTKEFRKTNALFVVFSGPRKGEKASKSTLGRWLRQAITEAYQAKGEIPPSGIAAHSTRSTAVSWAERAGATPDQICKAATWSNYSTFLRHYRLDLLSAADQAFGRKVLQAVVPP